MIKGLKAAVVAGTAGLAIVLGSQSALMAGSAGVEPSVFSLTAPSALSAEVDTIVETVRKKGAYPGIAVAIAMNGKVVYAKGYGTANLEYDVPVTADTVFPIGSITKSFTSLAIAQLAADGRLDLDASIADFFDDLPKGWEEIRVHHLMNHTSGIFNYINDPRFHANPGRDYSEAEMRAVFEAVPLGFETGSRMSYTNSGTYLLGRIIERVSGKSYHDYMQEYVFAPLGLDHTAYADHSVIRKGKAAGYRRSAKGFVNAAEWSPTVPFSAGALLSTVGDIAKYAHAVYGTDLTSDAIKKILQTQVDMDGEPLQYALGAVLIQSVNGHRKISHSGDIFGYSSHFAYYPEEGLSVVVLTNSQDGVVHPSSLERKLARAALGEAQPDKTAQAFSAEQAKPYLGNYSTLPVQFVSPTVGFTHQGDFLMFVLGGDKNPLISFPLLSLGDGKFAAAHDDEIIVTFSKDGNGTNRFDMVFYDGLLTGRR